MQHIWKFLKHRLAQVVTLMIFLALIRGTAGAQTPAPPPAPSLAFYPAEATLIAGDPNSGTGQVQSVPTPASYVGPANGWVAPNGFGAAATDSYGNVYVTENGGNIVRVIASGNGPIPVLPSATTPQAGYVYTVAGTGVNNTGVPLPVSTNCATPSQDGLGDNCPATDAIFGGVGDGNLGAITVDPSGNLYIIDGDAALIRVVYAGGSNNPAVSLINAEAGVSAPMQGYIYAIAGVLGQQGYTANLAVGSSGQANTTQIAVPQAIAVDANGNVFFMTYDVNAGKTPLLAIAASSSLPGVTNPTIGSVYTIVGENGTTTSGLPASSFAFSAAGTLSLDSSGNIYVGDFGASVIWVYYVKGTVPGLSNLQPGNIYTFAGGGSAAPQAFTSTSALSASVQPSRVAFDAAGDLYVSNGFGNQIDKIDSSGQITSLYGTTADATYSCAAPADSAEDGCASDVDGVGISYSAGGITVDPQGNVYVLDGSMLHELNASSPSLYFGYTQYQGTPVAPASQPVMIYNTGNAALSLSNLMSTSSAFTVASPSGGATDCTTTTSLEPGYSCEFAISYSPSSTSTANGTVTVSTNSNNATSGTNTVQLTGESAAEDALLPTTLTISSYAPADGISAGTPETFGFNLRISTLASSGTYPTGTVTLYSNGVQLGQSQSVSANNQNQSISFSNVTLPTGTNLIYAVYGGDKYYAGSQSTQQVIIVNGAASTTMLAASPNPAATRATVTLTAKVSSSSGTPSDGSVTFKSGSAVIGTSPVSGGSASVTTTAPPTAGTATFTASYAGSATYNPSTSSVSVTVQAPDAATTTVMASPAAPAEGAPVALTATVTATSGTTAPTGSVTFSINGSAQNPVMLTAGGTTTATAQLSVSNLPKGPNTITASYGGSTNGLFQASQTTTSTTVTVGLPATTTTVTASPNSITYGQPVMLSANVTPQASTTTPLTGSVTFSVGSTSLGTAQLNSGTATLTTTATNLLPGGASTISDTVTATYTDPTNTFASSTGTTSVSVASLTTMTSLSASTSSPSVGVSMTFTATVTVSSGPTPNGGTVTFYNGGTAIGSAALNNGNATLPYSFSSAGTDAITATYNGGNGFGTSPPSSPITVVIAAAPASTSTALTIQPTAPSTGQNVTFTATVTSGSGTPSGTVSFIVGTTGIGTGILNANGVATFSTSTLAAGSYTATAVYQGNNSYTASTSSSAMFTVSNALTASTTTLTLSSTAVQQGQNVTFTATVGPNSPISPTGTVTFMSGGQTLGQGTLYGGTATYSTATLNPGNYSVTAAYPGDSNFSGSNSNAVALAVATPTPSFTLSATPNNLTLTSGQNGAAIITLVPTYNYAGTVTLSCGTLPTNVTCSFAPATLTADGKNDAVQSTLTISTTGASTTTASATRPDGAERNGSMRVLAFLFLPVGLLGLGFTRKRKRLGPYLSLALLILLATGALSLSGCGGGNGGMTHDAAAGTSQITITAAGSTGSQLQTVNLAVTITQ